MSILNIYRKGLQLKNNGNIISALISTIFVIFLGYVIYSSNHAALPQFLRQFYRFPGGDKVGHVVLLAILSFIANYFLYPRHISIFKKPIFIGSLIVCCFITLEEFSQIYIPSRTFDLLDLSCSYLGIIAGDLGVRYKFGKSGQAILKN